MSLPRKYLGLPFKFSQFLSLLFPHFPVSFQVLGRLKGCLPDTAIGFRLFPPVHEACFLFLKLLLSFGQPVLAVEPQVEQTLFPFAGYLFMAAFQFVMAFFGQGLKFGIGLGMK